MIFAKQIFAVKDKSTTSTTIFLQIHPKFLLLANNAKTPSYIISIQLSIYFEILQRAQQL